MWKIRAYYISDIPFISHPLHLIYLALILMKGHFFDEKMPGWAQQTETDYDEHFIENTFNSDDSTEDFLSSLKDIRMTLPAAKLNGL